MSFFYKERVAFASRVRIQMSLTPERAPLDFFFHILLLSGCTAGFGYFAMKMDSDPVNCWVADENANDIIDPKLTEAVIQ